MTVDLVIPIHNIASRGFERVLNFLYSLEIQRSRLGRVLIPDSSDEHQYSLIHRLIHEFEFVDHFAVEGERFDKPNLFNDALRRVTSDYVFLTDCDYLFSKDLLGYCERVRGPSTLIFKKVLDLPPTTITRKMIKEWSFAKKKQHHWGTLANGAMQYATREFFEFVMKEVPAYQKLVGWGAMDNIMAYIAYNKGLDLHWLEEGEILHQYHDVIKQRDPVAKEQFAANQAILARYIEENELPQLLSRDE